MEKSGHFNAADNLFVGGKSLVPIEWEAEWGPGLSERLATLLFLPQCY